MKGIVADVVISPHRVNGLSGRHECSMKKFGVCGVRGISCVSIRSSVSQTCRETLSDNLRDR